MHAGEWQRFVLLRSVRSPVPLLLASWDAILTNEHAAIHAAGTQPPGSTDREISGG